MPHFHAFLSAFEAWLVISPLSTSAHGTCYRPCREQKKFWMMEVMSSNFQSLLILVHHSRSIVWHSRHSRSCFIMHSDNRSSSTLPQPFWRALLASRGVNRCCVMFSSNSTIGALDIPMKGGRCIKRCDVQAEGTSGWTCWNKLELNAYSTAPKNYGGPWGRGRGTQGWRFVGWWSMKIGHAMPVGAHVQRAHGQPALLPSFGPMDCGCSKRSKRFSKGWTGDIIWVTPSSTV